jgi:hypothetical protein
VDPDSTPDGVPDREEAPPKPAPAPRAAKSRTSPRPAATRPAVDESETREFEDFRPADRRPSRPESPDEPDLATILLEPAPTERVEEPGNRGERGDRDRSNETTVPTNIYRARRPAAAALLIIPAVALGFLLARGLAMAAFGPQFVLSGVIASSLALASLPLVVGGLYGLITGAAYGAEQWGFKVWARPPLAYLLVGLSFLVVAGLALR